MGTKRLICFIEISILFFLTTLLQDSQCQKRAGDKEMDLSDVNDLMISASPYTFLATVCQGVATRVSCQNPKSVMYIEDAFFGRANSYTCSSLYGKIANTRCHSETAFRQIWKLCNGHNTCTLQALTSVLGDPCPGTDKYIQIHFRCASPGRDTIGYCEPSQWGHWLDEDHPFGNGDSELLTSHQISSKVCESPVGMQIRTTDDVNFFTQNEIIRHSLTYGVLCVNHDQDDGQCGNYKVRYCCMHSEMPSSVSICAFPIVDDDVLVSPMDRNSWTEGSAISFKCRNPSDTLLGPTSIYCGPDGWMDNPPTCTPTNCRVLTKPVNGLITNTPTHRLGGSYQFDCLPGFVISGAERLVCQLNGQWNGRKPTCNVDKTVCGGIIMAADSGVIRSPNHPYLYPNNKDCSWQIAASPNKFIEITIESVDIQPNPRCRNDYIEVHNGTRGNSVFVRKLCGSWKERTYTSNENIMTVNFHSDKSHSGLGFTMRWKEIDGVDDSPKTCYGIGQSHFSTFDGQKLDFGGECSYVLTRSKSSANMKRPFVIEVVKETRHGSEGSWVASIVIRIQRFVITMGKGQQLVINDEIVSLPYHNKMNGIRIIRLGTFIKLTTEDQLVVQFDGMYSFTVSLPKSLMDNVEGLCGNYDGNPGNDMTLLGTDIITDDSYAFAEQFQTTTKECEPIFADPSPMGTEIQELCATEERNEYEDTCAIIMQKDGCFGNCHNQVDPEHFFDSCVKDACGHKDIRTAIAANIALYARMCQEKGAEVCESWRNFTGTVPRCSTNSYYSSCYSQCDENDCSKFYSTLLATKKSASSPECEECHEGCVCKEGYVRSGDECVLPDKCGCSRGGKYYKDRSSFMMNNCKLKCTCNKGRLTCKNHKGCDEGEKCTKSKKGRLRCAPTGKAKCMAWGDPHYSTLDGSGTYDFMGACSYVMVDTYTLKKTHPKWINIVTTNERRHGFNKVSYLKKATIYLHGGDTVVELFHDQRIAINGDEVESYMSDDFLVHPSGKDSAVFSTPYGVQVSFNENKFRLMLPEYYREKVDGLCGNFNGDPEDDLTTASGHTYESYDDFAVHHRTGQTCVDMDVPMPAECDPKERSKWSSKKYCGRIKDPKGGYATCHDEVDPEEFFETCVYDVCATEGSELALKESLQIYHKECLYNHVMLDDLDDDLGMFDDCPENSQFSPTASRCQDSCQDPYASQSCDLPGYTEQCVCDLGYLKDGKKCVQPSECGCRANSGAYYSVGQTFRNDRNQLCMCMRVDMPICATCYKGFEANDGVCEDINECNDNPCTKENSACVNTEGSYECVCQDGFIEEGDECIRQNLCSSSPCNKNADCISVGPSFTCRCKVGFVGDGLHTCHAYFCPEPPAISHGRISPPNIPIRYLHSKIQYECDEGYELYPATAIDVDCMYTGQWSITEVSCREIACSTPPEIDNGSVEPALESYEVGSSISYQCDVGFSISDPVEVECLPGGQWPEFHLPQCNDAFCMMPMFDGLNIVDINGDELTQDKFEVLEEIYFDCGDEGLLLIGPGDASCQEDGTWSINEETKPLCLEIACSPPPALDNGSVEPSLESYDVGSSVSYQCDIGFYISDPVEIECLPGGQWPEFDLPQCNDVFCMVPMFDGVNIVDVSGDDLNQDKFEITEEIYFGCGDGFSLDGPGSTMCQSTGDWSVNDGNRPMCNDLNECDSNPCGENAECLNTEGSFSCECSPGFQYDENDICQEITCQLPPALDNGSVEPSLESYDVGSSISYQCDVGFYISDPVEVECLPGGQWPEFHLPQCNDVFCMVPMFDGVNIIAENGDDLNQDKFEIAEEIYFGCGDGFSLDGPGSTMCQSTGDWSVNDGNRPMCNDMNECESNPCGENEECLNTEGSFSCQCSPGFQYDENDICQEILCMVPMFDGVNIVDVSGDDLNQDKFEIDEEIYFGCGSGFSLDGPASTMCQSTGDWSVNDGNRPMCNDLNECDSNPCGENEECLNTEGSFSCQCSPGFQYDENDICQEILCMVPMFDGVNIVDESGDDLNQDKFEIAEEIYFGCGDGFSLDGPGSTMCQSTGDWSVNDGNRPMCNDINECDSNPCGENEECLNTEGSFSCQCSPGFQYDENDICQEIFCMVPMFDGVNIVDVSGDDLNQDKFEIATEIYFGCADGFNLNGPGSTMCQSTGEWNVNDGNRPMCSDTNECGSNPCGENEDCLNTEGSFTCRCSPGYQYDENDICQEIFCMVPMFDGVNIVDVSGDDLNQDKFEIAEEIYFGCGDGFSLDGPGSTMCQSTGDWSVNDGNRPMCNDMNECDSNPCGENEECLNTEGSFSCQCSPGFQYDENDICQEILCMVPMFDGVNIVDVSGDDLNQDKFEIAEEIYFGCGEGFSLDGPGSTMCQSTGDWSVNDGNRPMCNDINECDSNPCGDHAECINIEGSFICECLPGFQLDANDICQEILCMVPMFDGINIVDVNGNDLNQDKFEITEEIYFGCGDGFSLDGPGSTMCQSTGDWSVNDGNRPMCNDINECDSNPCGENAECLNTEGSYSCECSPGFQYDENYICQEIFCTVPMFDGVNIVNEYGDDFNRERYEISEEIYFGCADGFSLKSPGASMCLPNGEWTITEGNRPTCNDINECERNPCGENEECLNTEGSFSCQCSPGFQYDKNDICQEIFCMVPMFDGVNIIDESGDDMNQDKFEIAEEIYFGCGDGFSLDGPGSTMCQSTGDWSVNDGNRPMCNDINECDSNPCGDSAECINTEGSFVCECLPGSRLNDYNVCIDDDECESNPCGENSKCINTRGSYTCRCIAGFQLDMKTDTCEEIFCPRPMFEGVNIVDVNGNDLKTEEFKFFDPIYFACGVGYTLQGRDKARCGKGRWSITDDTKPQCIDFDECSALEDICDSNAICENTEGSFSCVCEPGFFGDGIHCMNFGLGSDYGGDDYCMPPNDIENGFYTPVEEFYEADSNVTYQCQPGFELIYPGEDDLVDVYCLDGNWTIEEYPQCTDLCLDVECVLNQFCAGGECLCQRGYARSDPHSECEDVDECLKKDACAVEEKCLNTIGSYKCECADGFERNGDEICVDINECRHIHACSQNANCINNYGSYRCFCIPGHSDEGDGCERLHCDEPPHVPNSVSFPLAIGGAHPPGRSIRYSCVTGYKMADEGHKTVRCTIYGEWSNPFPVCEPITCIVPVLDGVMMQDENGVEFSESKFNTLQEIYFDCPEGFTLIGSTEARCLLNGMWSINSHNKPTCIEMECGDIPLVDNSEIKLSRDGKMAYVRCDDLYKLTGSYAIKCQDKEWSDAPTCTRVDCGTPPEVENAEINIINDHAVQYSCLSGFMLDRQSPTVRCQLDGNWESPPMCDPVRCDEIVGLENGYVSASDDEFTMGTTINFGCNTGYNLESGDELFCMENGEWSNRIQAFCNDVDECTENEDVCGTGKVCENTVGSYTCYCAEGYSGDGTDCKLKSCDVPPAPARAIIQHHPEPYLTGDKMYVRCIVGYTLIGPSQLKCQDDGTWSDNMPTCARSYGQMRWCSLSGDPHYSNFEGVRFDYQGKCLYDLVKTTKEAEQSGLTPFTIETQNEYRFGVMIGTWLKKAIVRLPNHVIELRKTLITLVNGVAVNLPYGSLANEVEIVSQGRAVKILTTFGILVRYDGDHLLEVGLSQTYSGAVEGLCGNANGNKEDDFVVRGSIVPTEDMTEFGDSYQVNSQRQCKAEEVSMIDPCGLTQRAKYGRRCEIITQRDGCFSKCHKYVDPNSYFGDCVFDLCASNGEEFALVKGIEAYAMLCQQHGAHICDWRAHLNSPWKCPRNAHYSMCVSGCPRTCLNPQPNNDCPDSCTEGCACNDGYVLSGLECVKPDTGCGCVYNGLYYKDRETHYTPRCKELCRCTEGRTICSPASCKRNERCSYGDNGKLGCKLPSIPCNEEPILRTIRLPSSCKKIDGKPYDINVGTCPTVACNTRNPGQYRCCGAIETLERAVYCRDGSSMQVMVVTKCGCKSCNKKTVSVGGRVSILEPDGTRTYLSDVIVARGKRPLAYTDDNGYFVVEVLPKSHLPMRFFDRNGVVVPTMKILKMKKWGGAVFHDIVLQKMPALINYRTNTKRLFHPVSTQKPASTILPGVVEVEVESNSYFLGQGQSIQGPINAAIPYIDPRLRSSSLVANDEFLSTSRYPLRIYGIFRMEIKEKQFDKQLVVGNIRIRLSTEEIKIPRERHNMKVYVLDELTGYWHEKQEMSASTRSTLPGLRQVSSNIPQIDKYRFVALATSIKKTCYAKVRAYETDKMRVGQQISYATIKQVTFEKIGSRWRYMTKQLTEPYTGACIPVPCDYNNQQAVTFTALLNGEEQLFAAPADQSGSDPDIRNKINYQRTEHDITVDLPVKEDIHSNDGPIYRDSYNCLVADVTANHFRFYRKTSPMTQYNTIPFDENNLFFHYQASPLHWYPTLEEFSACYIKVGLTAENSDSEVTFTSRALKIRTLDLIGVRDHVVPASPSGERSVCVEYQCSYLIERRAIRNVIEIEAVMAPGKKCERVSVDAGLEGLLAERKPVAKHNSQHMFRMLAPFFRSKHNSKLGVHHKTEIDPVAAKQQAYRSCSSDHSAPVVKFKCE